MPDQIVDIELSNWDVWQKLAGQVGTIEYDIAAVLLNRIRTRFLAETDPDGNKWPESFAAMRRKKRAAQGQTGPKAGGGTLFDTGRLFHSIKVDAAEAEKGILRIVTDVPYGRKHQYGEDGMPVRQFLGFSVEDEKLAFEMYQERLAEILGQTT